MLNPIAGKFIFINPSVEGTAWWHDTRAAPTAEAFKPKSWKKADTVLSGTRTCFRGAPGPPQDGSAAPPAATPGQTWWQQCRAENKKKYRKPVSPILKTPHPSISLPSSGAAIAFAGCKHRAGKELLGLGHDPRLKEMLRGLPAERQCGREEMMNNSELVVLNLMCFGISL